MLYTVGAWWNVAWYDGDVSFEVGASIAICDDNGLCAVGDVVDTEIELVTGTEVEHWFVGDAITDNCCCCCCCGDLLFGLRLFSCMLLGNEERECISILDAFDCIGKDCGRGGFLIFCCEFIKFLATSFSFAVDCWRSKYDWTAFFWNALSAGFGTRVVLLGSRKVYFWLYGFAEFGLFCCRSNSLILSATDCQLLLLPFCCDLKNETVELVKFQTVDHAFEHLLGWCTCLTITCTNSGLCVCTYRK